ncbi:MAG: porin [Bacteroidota bacterium]
MTKTKIYFLVMGLLISSFVFAQVENPFDVKWHNGFKFESADKQFKLKFGGRIMYDLAFFSQDDTLENAFGNLNNGTEFRRARFYSAGQLYHNVKYKLQLDFASGNISFKDVYIELVKLPAVGNFRVGHFKEPFRLEALTSSKYITFMERAFPIEFFPERNTGFMFYNDLLSKRISWQAGFFRRSDGTGNDKQADDGYNITGRLTGLPINNKEKRQLLHLGLAYSYRKPDNKTYEIKSKPESHLANDYVSTGTIGDVDNINLIGTEAALVLGSFSIQGEFVHSSVRAKTDTTANNYSFSTYYGQVSYFLTGENRNYKNSYLGFDRVSPKNNFGNGKGGLGALEIALRYSGINLDSDSIIGGQLNNITIGLNWHLNPATRIMTNYVLAQLNNVGNANIFQIRLQIDF